MADFGHRSCGIADHPSSYFFVEGCDRLVLVPVDADDRIQSCTLEQLADTLAWGDQLKFATTVPGRDRESNQDTKSTTIDVMHSFQVDDNSWASWQHVSDSFAQGSPFVTEDDATVATNDEDVARYLGLYS
jgi:hypothetical protein